MALQVIYSAGTTPNGHYARCSPLGVRKHPPGSPMTSPRAWKPVQPGYHPSAGHALIPHSNTPEVDHKPILVTEDDTNLKDSIPVMPRSIAIVCFVCNILFPGLGTFLSGTTVFCCAQVRPKGASKISVLKTNSYVALLQFATAFILLLGWIWSIMWGTSFLRISKESRYLEETGAADANHNSDEFSAVSHRRSLAGLTSGTPKAQRSNSLPVPNQQYQATDAPIIVLQEAPVSIHNRRSPDDKSQQGLMHTGSTSSRPPLNSLNPRQNRTTQMLRHQSDPDLFLSPQNLEDIVIHQAPVPDFMDANNSAGGGGRESDPPWKK